LNAGVTNSDANGCGYGGVESEQFVTNSAEKREIFKSASKVKGWIFSCRERWNIVTDFFAETGLCLRVCSENMCSPGKR
jgi:hypothetical protein